MCTISRNKFKRIYLINQILFVHFLLQFWNEHEISKLLNKKLGILAQLFRKLWTAKEVVT